MSTHEKIKKYYKHIWINNEKILSFKGPMWDDLLYQCRDVEKEDKFFQATIEFDPHNNSKSDGTIVIKVYWGGNCIEYVFVSSNDQTFYCNSYMSYKG